MKMSVIRKNIALVVIIVAGLLSGFSLYASPGRQLLPQEKLEVNKSLPTNKAGETYGTCYDMEANVKDPDLIKAEGVNGKIGYVRMTELEGEAPKTREEALDKNNVKDIKYVNVYEKDGKTIIDQFAISPGTVVDEGNIFEPEVSK